MFKSDAQILLIPLYTLPKNSIFALKNRPGPERMIVFQPFIFRGYVGFGECSIFLGSDGWLVSAIGIFARKVNTNEIQ